jgi:hypothetical protein
MVAKGLLHREYRGVYAVGHARLTLRGRWMAAVLACGRGAVLSHRAAAALWELRQPPSGPIDVTAPGRVRRGRAGIRLHSVRRLDAAHATALDGIPVTSLPRTLLDHAEVASAQQLRLAVEAAQRRDLLDPSALKQLMQDSPGRHGLRPLGAALAALSDEAPWTQSELEIRFLALTRAAGLPPPQCNVVVEGILVDFFWPRHRLVVEVDGYAFHKSRQSFEADRRRDAKLQLAGLRVLRATQARIDHEPAVLISEVTRLLSAWEADR